MSVTFKEEGRQTIRAGYRRPPTPAMGVEAEWKRSLRSLDFCAVC